MPCQLMGLRERGEAALDRGRLGAGPGKRADVQRDRLGRRRDGRELVVGALHGEVAEVAPVGAHRVRRLARPGVRTDRLLQLLPAGEGGVRGGRGQLVRHGTRVAPDP